MVAFASHDGSPQSAFEKVELVERKKVFSFSPTFDFSRARRAALSKP